MKLRIIISLMVLSFTVVGCYYQGYVKFEAPEQEAISTNKLREFMRNNKSPKIVLRVPSPELIATGTENNDPIYNAIENEFIKAGYKVRDRALFEEMLSSSDEKNNYEEISRRTDTDMILELLKLDTDVYYETNKYYTYNGEERVFPIKNSLSAPGAEARFKLILIDENEVAGSFTFHYAPCPNGCDVVISNFNVYYNFERVQTENYPYQHVEINELEEFIRRVTQDLIEHLENLRY
jgi:hypothetical protein